MPIYTFKQCESSSYSRIVRDKLIRLYLSLTTMSHSHYSERPVQKNIDITQNRSHVITYWLISFCTRNEKILVMDLESLWILSILHLRTDISRYSSWSSMISGCQFMSRLHPQISQKDISTAVEAAAEVSVEIATKARYNLQTKSEISCWWNKYFPIWQHSVPWQHS